MDASNGAVHRDSDRPRGTGSVGDGVRGCSEAVAEGEGSEGRRGCREDLGWDAHEGRDEKEHGNLFERVHPMPDFLTSCKWYLFAKISQNNSTLFISFEDISVEYI